MEPFLPFLMVDSYGLSSQADLQQILLNHGRLRDQFLSYYRFSPMFAISFITGNIVARYFNATLITNDSPLAKNTLINNSQIPTTSHPQILPHVQSFGGLYQVAQVWKLFCSSRNNKNISECPALIKQDQIEFNFVYCSLPRKKYDSTWHFRILSDPFDLWTWLVLSSALILVSWVVAVSSDRRYFETFLTVIATLLDNETTRILNSKLYALWLFATLLISDFYSGAITSQVIAPQPEITLTNFSDLHKNNYTLIFPIEMSQQAMLVSITQLSQKTFVNPTTTIISKMLKTSQVFHFQNGKYYTALTGNNRVATVFEWVYAMSAENLGNQHISRNNKANKTLKGKKCYIGKELLNAGEKFIIITSPQSARITGVFQRLFAFGILQRWDEELHGLLHSSRHQDRARVKGKTNLVKQETTVEALRMEGKIKTIFVLWTFCLGICFMAFSRECYCKQFLPCLLKIKTSNVALH